MSSNAAACYGLVARSIKTEAKEGKEAFP